MLKASAERLPREIFKKKMLAVLDVDQGATAIDVVKLAHPSTKVVANYGLARTARGRVLVELIHCQRESESWFVGAPFACLKSAHARAPSGERKGDTVQSDGALLLVTRCDPLLMSLALLDERRAQFSPLAQVLYPQATVLASCVGFDAGLVCDVERHGDDVYVRLNDDKTVAWLLKKLQRTTAAVLQSLASAQEVRCAPLPRKLTNRTGAERPRDGV